MKSPRHPARLFFPFICTAAIAAHADAIDPQPEIIIDSSLRSGVTAPGALTLSVEESAATGSAPAAPIAVFRLVPNSAEWHWRTAPAAPATGDRLQMALGAGNDLILLDPSQPAASISLTPARHNGGVNSTPAVIRLDDSAGSIVLTTGAAPGITIGGHPVLTQTAADSRYLRLSSTAISLGTGTSSSSTDSLAAGYHVVTSAIGQVAVGRYNAPQGVPNTINGAGPDAMFVVGNGFVDHATQQVHRRNAFAVYSSGSAVLGFDSVAWSSDGLSAGLGAVSSAPGQVAVGRYNVRRGYAYGLDGYGPDALFIVGNGTGDAGRSDAFLVFSNGAGYLKNSLTVGSGPGALVSPSGGAPSLAVGAYIRAEGAGAIAVGDNAFALAPLSTSLGGWVTASGWGSAVFGLSNASSGTNSFVAGSYNAAPGWTAVATGNKSAATGDVSFAANNSAAEGKYSASFGVGTKARAYSQFVIGRLNKVEGNPNAWAVAADDVDLFIVGNGYDPDETDNDDSDIVRSNAFTVTNGGDVRAAGVIRVKRAGDISMGAFMSGPLPNP